MGWTWGGDWKSLKDYHHFEKQITIPIPQRPVLAANMTVDDLRDMYVRKDGRHAVFVERRNVIDPATRKKLPKRRVSMRVCEVGELSDPDREFVVESFDRWYEIDIDALKEPLDRDAILYQKSYIRRLRTFLSATHPNRAKRLGYIPHRVYMVLSETDVEALIMVTHTANKSDFGIYTAKPDNLEPFVRFKGAGDQVLWYALWRELESGQESFTFSIRNGVLDTKGLRTPRVRSYNRTEILDIITRRVRERPSFFFNRKQLEVRNQL